MVVAHRIGAATPYAGSEEGKYREKRELKWKAQRQQQSRKAGRDRRASDENEKEARCDQLGDQEQDAPDQPKPLRVELEVAHSPAFGTLAGGLAFGAGARLPLRPIASLASSPIPPSVPISWVASTGNRIVFALGERANSATASTYFWATK